MQDGSPTVPRTDRRPWHPRWLLRTAGPGVGMLVALAACGGSPVTAGAHPTQAQPSATPSPTAAVAPNPAGPAVLGATFDAFVAAEGPAKTNTADRLTDWRMCSDGVTPRLAVAFDEQHRADTIYALRCASDAPRLGVADARPFFPGDAQLVHVAPRDGRQQVITYRSLSLRRWFGPSWFTDCTGHPVPGGTFSLVLNEYGGFDLLLGACHNA